MDSVSIIIPAYNEEERIERTLQSLLQSGDWFNKIIVVDDGSTDATRTLAKRWTEHVLQLGKNQGKAEAIKTGCAFATEDIFCFLDADLGESAALALHLVEPIQQKRAEMTVAILPPARHTGFGLVKSWAAWRIYKKTGFQLKAPLSGQRAIRRTAYEACYRGDQGFGLEVGLTMDLLLAGSRIEEIELAFRHRQTGRNLAGFLHRFKQGVAVNQAFLSRR